MPLTTVQSGMMDSVAQYYSFKNRIINGGMVIDQRANGAVMNMTGATYGTCDRWSFQYSVASKFTAQRNAGSVTPPVGFTNYLGVTSTSAYSVTSGDYSGLIQYIEGFNTADFGWGTASASTVTLSFWVRSSLTGTFGGTLINSPFNRSYPFTYTISVANTWEQKSITIAGDTTGTWIGATNGIGLGLIFSLGTGSTYSGTAGAWTSSGLFSATGATSVIGTNGATWYVTGVQLEKGVTATSFDYRPYGTELALCQRYYCKSSSPDVVATNSAAYTTGGMFTSYNSGAAYSTTAAYGPTVTFPVTMRTPPPTFTFINPGGLVVTPTAGQWTYYSSGAWQNTTAIQVQSLTSNAANFSFNGTFIASAYLMFYGAWTASAEF
jgi:hypothetical protein